jgi:hypothetical protein
MDVPNYLKLTPPRCLRGLRPVSVSARDDEAVWRLQCACGAEAGVILGYPLGDLKPGFEGSDILVSPFTFQCEVCGQHIGILDTDEHGQGAEYVKLFGYETGCAAYRGEGEPVRAACPRCGWTRLAAVVTLYYNDEDIWAWEDDPSFPLAACFNVFRLDCCCLACQHSWEVSLIDTKA